MLIEVSSPRRRLSDSKLPSSPDCSSSRNTKIEILGIVVSQDVTIVGTPSYTSGAQLCSGAAATLNRKPIPIRSSPHVTPSL